MKKKPHPPHPIHSGDAFLFEGDKHYVTHHIEASTQDALDVCARAIRSVPTKTEREALIGRLLSGLVHEHAIDGLLRSITLAMSQVDHYNHGIEHRHY